MSDQTWKKALTECFTNLETLLEYLDLQELVTKCHKNTLSFPLRVPKAYADKIQRGDRHDPLLKQILPLNLEESPTQGFSIDPLEEHSFTKAPGILQKYKSRALVITTGACAIHCRYCFRRHFAYDEHRTSKVALANQLSLFANDTNVNEIILSGGDPLSLTDDALQHIVNTLKNFSNIQRLRIHTRFPIVIPERITDNMLDIMTSSHLQTIFVVHANHANEIDGKVKSSMLRLKQHGVTLLNQSVLLRGINNSTDALAKLSNKLFDCGVLPYYLHLLDKVEGTAHFDVDEFEAVGLVRDLQANLPGYLVPKLVREEPGAESKTLIQI